MKIIFLAYRDWALKVFCHIESHPKVSSAILCNSSDELKLQNLASCDLLITLGWSEELGEEVCSYENAIGLHCAELDRYSYGSPLQLQIIDGIVNTKHRIFPFKYDSESKRAHTHTRQFSHEVDLSLHGSIKDIFHQLTATSITLLNKYLDDYPNIEYKIWPVENIIRPKRIPGDSRLDKDDFSKFSTEYLYNFIRSLESPYPNAFIEDDFGTLYFEQVKFKRK